MTDNKRTMLSVSTVPATHTQFLLPHYQHLARNGWQIDVAAGFRQNDVPSLPCVREAYSIPWSRSVKDVRALQASVRRIRDIAHSGQYDIVHVHSPIAAFVTRYALKSPQPMRQPAIVYTVHGFHFHAGGRAISNTAYRALETIASPWTSAYVVMNEEDEEAVQQLPLDSSAIVTRIPSIGIDEQYYDRTTTDMSTVKALRNIVLGNRRGPIFTMVAELHPNKRHEDVFHAFRLLDEPEAVLVLIGDGSLRVTLRHSAHKLGISHQVKFMGYQSDVRSWFCASDAVLLASDREGLPRALLEAMALGVPVIGTNTRGIRDLLIDSPGILTPVRDPGGLRAALRIACDNLGELTDQARSYSEIIRANHNLTVVAAQYDAIYNQLADRSTRAADRHPLF